MAQAIEIAGDIAAASTALSGLLLVFLGAIATGYDSFPAESQGSIRTKYKRRATLAIYGFFASLAAAAFSIGGKWIGCATAVDASAILLGASLILVGIAAWLTYTDIGGD